MMSTSPNSSQMPASGRQFLHTNVRHPSIGSSCNLVSHHKMSSTDIYHVTDNLATKVPCHQISAQEFDDNNHLVVSWLIKSHPGLAALRGIFSNETTTPLMSQLKSNEMVRRGIRCQEKFLNRQGDSSTKKVKREAQSYMKTRWNKCQKMRVGTFNRWSAERDMEDIMCNVKEELQKDQREMDEQSTKKMQEAILSFQVQSYMNSDFDSALVQVEKQLTVIPDSIMRIKDQMGTWSSMADLASKTTDCCAEKERNREALERCQEVEVVKESVSTGEKTSAVEKLTELQKLKTGFRICKPQGTFLSPKMGANDGSSPVAVQVEDLFLVHTPPVSSCTSLAPPQLPYHHQHPTTSPSRPVPERCAVTVPVKTAQSNEKKNANHGCSSTTSNTALINLNDIPDSDGAFTIAATERYVNEMVQWGIPPLRSTLCESKNNDSSLHSQARKSCGGAPKREREAAPLRKRKKNMCIPQMMSTSLNSSQVPPLGRQFLQTNDTFFHQTDDQGIGEKRFDVGCVYVDYHQNLPTRTPAQPKFICVVMVTNKKTQLNVVLRYPSIGSPWNFLSHNRMGSSDIYPLMDEISVMETHLAGEVLCRRISAQEFDDNQVDGLWLIKNYPEPAALHGIFNKETTLPLLSQLKSNEMVRFGILREVNFFNRQGDSSTSHPRSSTISAKGSEEKLDHESDEDTIEVMESKGTLFKSPTLRHVLKFEARKRIGGTELLDHLLKHVAGKLAPGGAEHCRRRPYADGQMEYWLESAYLVKVKKEAGLQDPCWTPPGWTPGDCRSQDPLCAKELRLLKEENAKIKREMNVVVGSPDKYCTSAQLASKLSKVRQNRGGGPKKKQSKAKKKAIENKFPIIPIDDDINLDDHLKIDILKGNERFGIPVADQGEYLICGSVSVADTIGLAYSLKRQTFRPVIAAQEPIDWLKHHEPDYDIDTTLQEEIQFHDDGYSQPFAVPDIYDFVKENGIHLEGNYSLKRACTMTFPQKVEDYEKMRSKYIDGQAKQRFSFDKFNHLVIKKSGANAKKVLEIVKKALKEKRPVNGLIWASEEFIKFDGKGIFDQSLSEIFYESSREGPRPRPDHVILIEGYGEYKGHKFLKIKNSWSSKWAGRGKGRAYIAVRQVREFTYISGDVYCMGQKPPKRIVVFYTTKKSKELAEDFVERSNEKYASAPLTNCVHTSGYSTYCRHADYIFFSNDLESYASSAVELERKLKKEFLVFFVLTNKRADKKYLKSLNALSDMENKEKCLQNLQYSVFKLQSIDEKINSGLHNLGASCFNESVKDDGDEVTFTKWQEMIWKKLDEYGVEKVAAEAKRIEDGGLISA